jgi:hypothetical protein
VRDTSMRANRSSLPVKFRAMFGSHENVDYAERFAIAKMVACGFGAWTANAALSALNRRLDRRRNPSLGTTYSRNLRARKTIFTINSN